MTVIKNHLSVSNQLNTTRSSYGNNDISKIHKESPNGVHAFTTMVVVMVYYTYTVL